MFIEGAWRAMIRLCLDKINALHSFMSATGYDPHNLPGHVPMPQLPCSISAPFAISLRVETLPSPDSVRGEAQLSGNCLHLRLNLIFVVCGSCCRCTHCCCTLCCTHCCTHCSSLYCTLCRILRCTHCSILFSTFCCSFTLLFPATFSICLACALTSCCFWLTHLFSYARFS